METASAVGQPPATPEKPPRLDSNLFRLLVDRVVDYAIFLLTPEGRVATWNAGAERLKQYTALEIVGQSFDVFYSPEARAAGLPQKLLQLARVDGRVEDEGYRYRKDGTPFWADVVITALRDDSGELVGFAKVTRDLTERRQAEEERARRMAAERASDRFERLQLATAALTATSRQQHVGEVLADMAVAGLGLAADIVAFVTTDRSSLEIVAAHGFDVDAEIPDVMARSWRTAKPIFGSGSDEQSAVPLIFGQRVLGVLGVEMDEGRALDVDERAFLLALTEVAAQAMDRARLFESEHQARAEAEAAVHAQDEFLSIASHELRTPVAAVKATAQLAQRAIQRGGVEPERITRHLETIARASDRLNALVEDLLDVSRLRTGQLQLRKQPMDLVVLIQEAVGRHAAGMIRHRVEFSAPSDPVQVNVDPLRIEQVLDNLLSNAVKYSPGGGDIELRVDVQSEVVTVSVTDPGIGLPPGQEGRIFETFGRASNAAAQQIPGLGLGLSICQQLIERHGGRIWATSPGENLGTTVAFSLPSVAHD